MTCSAAGWGLVVAVLGMEGYDAFVGFSGDEAIALSTSFARVHNRTERWEQRGLDSTPTRSVSAVCGASVIPLMKMSPRWSRTSRYLFLFGK